MRINLFYYSDGVGPYGYEFMCDDMIFDFETNSLISKGI